MYAEQGAVVKALAQYKLALRIEPSNKQAQQRIEALHSNKAVKENRPEPVPARCPEARKPGQQRHPALRRLHPGGVHGLHAGDERASAAAGVPIVEQHDTGKSVYIIASGSVKVFTTLLAGERIDLAVLGPSDFFGEMSFLTGKPRTATVETAEDSVILEVTEDKLKEVVASGPMSLTCSRNIPRCGARALSKRSWRSNK